jgi:AcrR family transcriptional regulator
MAKSGPRRLDAVPRAAADVKSRLIDAAIVVLARDGFAHASARVIAAEAGGVNGLIYYHFGSMDQLLTAVARALADRGMARIKAGLGGERAGVMWPERLGEVVRAEAAGDDGRAVMELLVGARTSPELAAEVKRIIDDAIAFVAAEIAGVVAGTSIAALVPSTLLAELAGAAFLGLEVLLQNGRAIDVDELARVAANLIQLASSFGRG